MKTFYNYTVTTYASGLDEYGDCYPSSSSTLELNKFFLVKESDKTWCVVAEWDNNSRHKHYIRKSSRKKFAYPTIEEAANGFLMRKNRQIEILTGQLDRAKNARYLIQNEIENLKNKNK